MHAAFFVGLWIGSVLHCYNAVLQKRKVVVSVVMGNLGLFLIF